MRICCAEIAHQAGAYPAGARGISQTRGVRGRVADSLWKVSTACGFSWRRFRNGDVSRYPASCGPFRSGPGLVAISHDESFQPTDERTAKRGQPCWLAVALVVWLVFPGTVAAQPPGNGQPLAGTEPLTLQGDIASQLVEGVDRFLLDQLAQSEAARARHWQRDDASPEAYAASLLPNRRRLATGLGMALGPDGVARLEPGPNFDEDLALRYARFEPPSGPSTWPYAPTTLTMDGYEATNVRWLAGDQFYGEGWLLDLAAKTRIPVGSGAPQIVEHEPGRPWVIVVPDADQTPEQMAGLTAPHAVCPAIAARLARSGVRVLVPYVVSRQRQVRHPPEREGGATLTDREYLYRPGFELGRHLIALEVQKLVAAIDVIYRMTPGAEASPPRVGLVGWGEGAALSLYTAALDPRVDSVLLSGYFGDRRAVWQQPIDRNVFGLLDEFGDAELVNLIAPRSVVIEAAQGPQLDLPGDGGAPARLETPSLAEVKREFARAQSFVTDPALQPVLELIETPEGQGSPGSTTALAWFLSTVAPESPLAPPEEAGRRAADGRPASELAREAWVESLGGPEKLAERYEARRRRQVGQLDRHLQARLQESPYERAKFLGGLDSSSAEAYARTSAEYRQRFRRETIGQFELETLPPRPRSRQVYDAPRWTGYEVVLDVWPEVIAYGILLLPKDLKAGERRPVVVCQHGLEGRPQDVIGESGRQHYQMFAARLADEGFITFAPQNLYLFGDRFRSLQRKANPLGKTLFSIIVPQHRQITDWLASLPMVDPERIGFYGLSYGGKSAMRIPPLVDRYCLSICSADFNEWVWKNASTRSPYSYVWTGEYEIFEWNLGGTFNYAEMAALIAPRPFMVERGHHDGVAPDEAVAWEYAKVRRLYAALGIAERTEIEFFDGPHQIHGVGTFAFLRRHLRWPEQ